MHRTASCGCTGRRERLYPLLLPAIVLVMADARRASAAPAESLLTPNRMAVVDGKPRFLLGLYENPKDDAVLNQAVQAGFNLIRSSADKDALNRLHKHGAKAWVNLGGDLDLSRETEARQARLLSKVNALKDHPALLIWEGPDEALWSVWYAQHIDYFGLKEFGAMDAAVKEARKAGTLPPREIGELARLADQCKNVFDRSLWQAFDAKRSEFWRRMGKQPARPESTMADRADEARRVGEGMTRGIQAVRQTDPKHLIWLNHAPRNSIKAMQHFNRAADMAGCDIYPVPADRAPDHSDLRSNWLSCVGAYTERMRAAAPAKACAMVLQGFGWRDIHEGTRKYPEETGIGRRPKFRETRFMAYDAIVHGANAIMYWGTAYIEKDSQLWRDLLRLACELSALQPALVAETIQPGPVIVSDENFGSSDGDGLAAMLKREGSDVVLIVVNETPHGLPFRISGLPADLEGKSLHRLGTDENVAVNGRAFRDGVRGFDVHIYATSRRFEPKKQ